MRQLYLRRRVSYPPDIILSVHPKGRNRERLITALQKIRALSPTVAKQELELIHTRNVTHQAAQGLIRAGFFPGRIVGEGVVVGKKIQGRVHPELFIRQGIGGESVTDVRPIRTELMGKWKKIPLRIIPVRHESLPSSMWLEGPSSAISHLSRSSKIFFQGFDSIVPSLANAGLLKTIPTRISDYEKCRTRNNPFRVVGRFLEVSDKPQHFSKFSLLANTKIPVKNLPNAIRGKKVGVRGEDFALAELILKQKGVQCQLINVVNPEAAVRDNKVDFAFAHVTSGETARSHNLNWAPLFYSSQVAVVHKDALKNEKVRKFLAELKKKHILY